MPKTMFGGLLVPAITPFKPDLTPDRDAFVDTCKWLLANGAHGLAVMGTTSEANSLSTTERMDLLEGLVGAGVDPSVLMPGVGTCSITDTIALTRHAVSLGCGGVLALPPFYYKPVTSDGLFAAYDTIIQAVGSSDLGLWLYHIPQMTGVGVPHDLVARLIDAHPRTVLGIKDSSGDWDNTEALLKTFPGFRVFPSSEGVIVRAAALGGVGCISASGNINPSGIRALLEALGSEQESALQARAAAIRQVFAGYPLIAAAKAVLSRKLNDQRLKTLRPPLIALSDHDAQVLIDQLVKIGWQMDVAA
ncbi:dihydrodipicolinate synthase family protein [Pelagibacterium sp.]|uniref:dihydrodipicolinate synthase family protein n=1 Tax=Pelagibacterium sp. TaxID=1967288 RepID=UPI003A94AABC